jgi:pimeloyl-ACP methyl ester carboxylesterase
MIGIRKPRVVVTIHGIRTRGKWQKSITPYLASHGLVPYHIDFGWFSAFQFFFPWTRERQLRAIQSELRSLVEKAGVRRISVVAHSFGTMLAIESLCRDNGGLLYDRVVLTGSILPSDFDWATIMSNKWVLAVRNERATSDWVVQFARLASRPPFNWISRLNAGNSGREPFHQRLPALMDDFVVGHHSETHNPQKFERWARFFSYPLLPDDVLQKVSTEIQALRQEAAQILNVAVRLIRVNMFAPMDGALRIVPGATDNMSYAPEFGIKIVENHGATGAAFSTGGRHIVVKRGDTWTGNTLPGDELEKIHPGLKWVISLPVRSEVRSIVMGIVNIDGLATIPQILRDLDSEECKARILALHLGMLKRFVPCLEAGFRGDPPPQIEV